MVHLTKAQRKALKRIYERKTDTPLQMTYREFRKAVERYPDGSGCVMVAWAGMWLGIERDGYTHS